MDTIQKNKYQQIADLMEDFIHRTIDFYQNIKTYPVLRPADKDSLQRLKAQKIPFNGRPAEEVYQQMLEDVYSNVSYGQHPRSFACIPSTASLYSWMGDVMTSAYNPHASCQINSPGPNEVEKSVIRWMCDLAGYPQESGGLFVSGGSIANLTALTAARDAKLKEDQRQQAVVYISDQTHSSIAKGLHIIGFLPNQIRKIPTDEDFRMSLPLLQEQIEEDLSQGKRPFAIVATAGTTNTGSVDPLPEIAAICKKQDMWMHVDGAFGASALVSPRYRKSLAGIELSDSLSWDAHKWLMQTFACSVVLVRNQSHLANSFAAHPEYLKDAQASEDSIEFWDLGPELTRPARALKLWMTLQILGTEQISQTIDHGCEMAKLAEDTLLAYRNWEIISSAQLGILNFRYRPAGLPELQLDQLNQEIAREITDSGYAQIFTTVIKGKKVLRLCTLHPDTTVEDIITTIEYLNQCKAVSPFLLQAEGEAAAC